MNCPVESRESEVLLAYCAGKMDPARSVELEEHIEACVACREFAQGQQAVWKALDAWEPAPVSADFNRRLYARIEQDVSWWDLILRPFRPLNVRHGLPVAAAAGVIIMAGLLLDRPVAMSPGAAPQSAVIESVAPDQADQTLSEMEMMRELNRMVHTESADSKI